MEKREIVDQIVVILKSYNPGRGMKLESMISDYDNSTNEKDKKKYAKKVHDFLFNLYFKYLNRNCGTELFGLNCTIQEMCHQIESHYGYRYYVGERGIYSPKYDSNGKVLRDLLIPRTYLDGYQIDENMPLTGEVINFYYDNIRRLEMISEIRDKRSELITDGLSFRDEDFPEELGDLFFNYLGMVKLTEEEKAKKNNNNLNK